MLIKRGGYLEALKRHQDKSNLIKVVTGVRRAGKSTLLELFRKHLLESGVAEKRIISINLESRENAACRNGDALYDRIKSQIKTGRRHYVFIDEFQMADGYEDIGNSLRMMKNVDLYVTGSNSRILSGERAGGGSLGNTTKWGGRYIDIRVLPLSFGEYSSAFTKKNVTADSLFRDYIEQSSFPETLSYVKNGAYDKDGVQEYLDGIYNAVIVKDIMTQPGVKNVAMLERIVNYMFSNIGSETSINGIVGVLNNDLKLRADEKKVYSATVENYLDALQSGYLFYKATRYYAKGKEYLKTNAKYYAVDVGMRYHLLGGDSKTDAGHILENVVYLELMRRGYKIKVGKVGDKEVDFVAQKPGGMVEYYQVSQSVLDPATLRRELEPLEKIRDNHPKFLLTRDYDSTTYKGIEHKNVLEWLLGKS
ncbi:MAG: ATP-binding protein [Chitinispirillia bacterium]|nr:ATP-binding protein [Chitinispirillia bacterium]